MALAASALLLLLPWAGPAPASGASGVGPGGEAANVVSASPAADSPSRAPSGRPSWRHRLKSWMLPVGVFLLAMLVLGFVASAALFGPPAAAWFIYLFLIPFFIWIPGMTLGRAASWVVCGGWIVAFPVVRWWLYRTPSGSRWRRARERWIAGFGGGDGAVGGWRWIGSGQGRGGAGRGGTRSGSVFSGRGGRFGGGGASSRW